MVVDKMVATVNGELITYSDVLWQLALQPASVLESPSPQALDRALRLIIDQRLIMQEAEKRPAIGSTDQEVEAALNELIKQFPSQAEFSRRVRRVGLDAEQLREIVRRRLRVEKYLDFEISSSLVKKKSPTITVMPGFPDFDSDPPGELCQRWKRCARRFN